MVRSLILLCRLASACRLRTENHLSVTNPLPAGDPFPEVVNIDIYDLTSSRSLCSGVFVRPRRLLTAAHCVYTAEGDGEFRVTYTGANGVVHEGKMFPAPRYNRKGDIYDNTGYDLALISFDTDVAPVVARLAPTTPMVGETMTIVGYGETDRILRDGSGTKTPGRNRIQKTRHNISVLDGFMNAHPISPCGQRSLCAKGDSGGGMFNERGELGGIMSSGYTYMDKDDLGNPLGNASIVNLAHPGSLASLNEINDNLCAGKSLNLTKKK